jgi:hypothetical protein
MKKEFSICTPWDRTTTQVTVKLSKYSNGRTAITLVEQNEEFGELPYAVASVNLPDVLLLENEVLIKDYSENEGMYEFLLTNNIVKHTTKGYDNGFVWFPIGILNPESEWGLIPNVSYSHKEEEEDETTFSTFDNNPPPPIQRADDGKGLWLIDGYRVWATDYQQALALLPMIKSF